MWSKITGGGGGRIHGRDEKNSGNVFRKMFRKKYER
jgi:hypothetical protein